jgi:hypothetical protein
MKRPWAKMGIFTTAIILLFIQCTPYQSAGFTGGFSETKLDENVWKVQFKGNGYTNLERASDLCLLRSAELCLINGYTHFATVESDKYVSQHQYTTSSRKTGRSTHTVSKPRTAYTIVCYEEKPEEFSYNARFLLKSLMAKYELVGYPGYITAG